MKSWTSVSVDPEPHLLSTLRQALAEDAVLSPGDLVVVAVSGGLDSMVLADLLRRLPLDLQLAHVNYGVRAAADQDAQSIRDWASSHNLPLETHLADTEGPPSASFQSHARSVRYAFFRELATTTGARAVLTAHHQDDQAETLLLQLGRGTGLEGLAAMPRIRPLFAGSDVPLYRPLLAVSRSVIQQYAIQEGVPWTEDASNASLAYQRNAIRHQVLPVLRQIFGDSVDRRMARSARIVRGYLDTSWEAYHQAAWERCVEEGHQALQVEALLEEPDVWQGRLVLEAVRRWGLDLPLTAETSRRILGLCQKQPGRRVAHHGSSVWRDRDALVFETSPPSAPDVTPIKLQGISNVPGGTLTITMTDERPASFDTGTPTRIYVDASVLQEPLTWRGWKDGDRFAPLGMDGHSQLVSDALTNAKVPTRRRREIPVLCSGPHILWVVGIRQSEATRVTPSTDRIAKLSTNAVPVGV